MKQNLKQSSDPEMDQEHHSENNTKKTTNKRLDEDKLERVELASVRVEYTPSSGEEGAEEPIIHKIYSPKVSFGRKPTGIDSTCPFQFNLQVKNSTFVSRQHFVMELVSRDESFCFFKGIL